MEGLARFFNAKLWRGSDGWDLSVGQIDDLLGVSLHFDEYPLPSILHAEYLVWFKFVNISHNRWVDGERHSKKEGTGLTLVIPKLLSFTAELERLVASRNLK